MALQITLVMYEYFNNCAAALRPASRVLTVFFWIALCGAFSPALAQSGSLKLERIMDGEHFTGYWPENPAWSADGSVIYFDWNPGMEPERTRFAFNIADEQVYQPVGTELAAAPSGDMVFNHNRNMAAWHAEGDIYLFQVTTGDISPVIQTNEPFSVYGFSANDSLLLLRSRNNIFAWSIYTGNLQQITDFRQGRDPDAEKTQADYKAWIERDQERLFQVIRDQNKLKEFRKNQREARRVHKPRSIYTGDKSIFRVFISSDTRYVVYMLAERSEPESTAVPDFMHASGQVTNIPSRPKVGWEDQGYSLHIYDRQNDSIIDVDTEQIPGIFDKPPYLREYHRGDEPWNNQYEKPRKVVFTQVVFNTAGKAAVEIKAQDNKDRWLMMLDPTTGKLSLIERQHDEAWINGPGISGWNLASGELGWFTDRELWYQSEATGYSHLYSYNAETNVSRPLTSGQFEVHQVFWFEPEGVFYLLTNEGSPFNQHIYKLNPATGQREALTTQDGKHEFMLSPDGRNLAIRHSTATRPWELYIAPANDAQNRTQITRSVSEEFEQYNWRTPRIVHFEAADGTMIPARLYKPDRPRRNGPAVIFVHGAGYLQNVHNWWSSYYREYMFHNMLVDKGYTVLDIDFRASAGYGRDWRTAIYRHMGGLDLSDQVDGARYLVEYHSIDPSRIGIYGGSYGGFISIMAMLLHSDVFACGAALRSVTDWAHYNHPYTSNILNTPVLDSLAFARSSPIYFAEGLGGPLLMLHGMVDVNVQYQDVVRLAQRFIELGKDGWELAVYPVEDHGFTRGDSWTDEYRRILELFEKHLK